MDERRLRRNGRLGDDFSGGGRQAEPAADAVREDWGSFRDRVDQEWRERRANPAEQGTRAETAGSWLNPSEVSSGAGPSEFSVEDFRERLLGGPSAELFGGVGGPHYAAESAATGRDENLSQDEESDQVVAELPQQAHTEYVDKSFDELPDPELGSGLVRPYFRTQGRTRPTQDLAIEALISTSEHGRMLDRVRVPEHRSICDLCLDTRSVAEVAALLRLPLGVVRVLIGDVAGLGLVLVHSGSTAAGDRPSIEFMERVLSGLRRI